MFSSSGAAPWMESGGAYLVVFGLWALILVFFVWMGGRLGKELEAGTDGCLLQFSVPFMVGVGGGAGLYLAPYPMFVIASPAGALFLNALVFGVWLRGMRGRQ
ncbi:MAG: hypothetical protein ACOYON_16235 [Fimbriimonas sp.]